MNPLDPKSFGKVAVLMGGPSGEREVSLNSGRLVLKALRSKGVDAHPFDPAIRDVFELRDGFTCAFNALHGRFGEDGTIQAILEVLRIPYTGSGVAASALAMDKWRTKLCWIASGLPTPAYAILSADSDWSAVTEQLGLPIAVKPIHEGSTLGFSKVKHIGDLPAAFELAARGNAPVIAEQFIEGHELTVTVVDGVAYPSIKIEPAVEVYTYDAKYISNATRYHCPAGLPDSVEHQLRDYALKAYAVVGARGCARVDAMVRPTGEIFLLEINTSPGMTDHSLVPMAAKAIGVDYPTLAMQLLAGATLDRP